MIIRKVIACSKAHTFADVVVGQLHGLEIIVAAGESEPEVDEKLGSLARTFRWERGPVGEWTCSLHRDGFIDGREFVASSVHEP